jgi:hypothetical protein
MNEVIMQLVADMKAIEVAIQKLKPEFEVFIADKTVPLATRWQTWLDAPDSLKNTDGWISDGRLEAFKLIGYGDHYNDAIAYEDGLVWAERYQTIDMVDIIGNLLESLLDKFDVTLPDDFDWGNLDGYASICPEMYEFFVAYREELLAKNLKSFKFDW